MLLDALVELDLKSFLSYLELSLGDSCKCNSALDACSVRILSQVDCNADQSQASPALLILRAMCTHACDVENLGEKLIELLCSDTCTDDVLTILPVGLARCSSKLISEAVDGMKVIINQDTGKMLSVVGCLAQLHEKLPSHLKKEAVFLSLDALDIIDCVQNLPAASESALQLCTQETSEEVVRSLRDSFQTLPPEILPIVLKQLELACAHQQFIWKEICSQWRSAECSCALFDVCLSVLLSLRPRMRSACLDSMKQWICSGAELEHLLYQMWSVLKNIFTQSSQFTDALSFIFELPFSPSYDLTRSVAIVIDMAEPSQVLSCLISLAFSGFIEERHSQQFPLLRRCLLSGDLLDEKFRTPYSKLLLANLQIQGESLPWSCRCLAAMIITSSPEMFERFAIFVKKYFASSNISFQMLAANIASRMLLVDCKEQEQLLASLTFHCKSWGPLSIAELLAVTIPRYHKLPPSVKKCIFNDVVKPFLKAANVVRVKKEKATVHMEVFGGIEEAGQIHCLEMCLSYWTVYSFDQDQGLGFLGNPQSQTPPSILTVCGHVESDSSPQHSSVIRDPATDVQINTYVQHSLRIARWIMCAMRKESRKSFKSELCMFGRMLEMYESSAASATNSSTAQALLCISEYEKPGCVLAASQMLRILPRVFLSETISASVSPSQESSHRMDFSEDLVKCADYALPWSVKSTQDVVQRLLFLSDFVEQMNRISQSGDLQSLATDESCAAGDLVWQSSAINNFCSFEMDSFKSTLCSLVHTAFVCIQAVSIRAPVELCIPKKDSLHRTLVAGLARTALVAICTMLRSHIETKQSDLNKENLVSIIRKQAIKSYFIQKSSRLDKNEEENFWDMIATLVRVSTAPDIVAGLLDLSQMMICSRSKDVLQLNQLALAALEIPADGQILSQQFAQSVHYFSSLSNAIRQAIFSSVTEDGSSILFSSLFEIIIPQKFLSRSIDDNSIAKSPLQHRILCWMSAPEMHTNKAKLFLKSCCIALLDRSLTVYRLVDIEICTQNDAIGAMTWCSLVCEACNSLLGCSSPTRKSASLLLGCCTLFCELFLATVEYLHSPESKLISEEVLEVCLVHAQRALYKAKFQLLASMTNVATNLKTTATSLSKVASAARSLRQLIEHTETSYSSISCEKETLDHVEKFVESSIQDIESQVLNHTINPEKNSNPHQKRMRDYDIEEGQKSRLKRISVENGAAKVEHSIVSPRTKDQDDRTSVKPLQGAHLDDSGNDLNFGMGIVGGGWGSVPIAEFVDENDCKQ